MRVVTLEEHYTVPSLVRRISPEAIARRGFVPRKVPPGKVNPLDLLPEMGEVRLRAMDEAGITVQVLSTSGPGADLVDGAEGVAIARGMNEKLIDPVFIKDAVGMALAQFPRGASPPMPLPRGSAAEQEPGG